MIEIKISTNELKDVEYYRFNHPSVIVQKRMHILYLKTLNLSHELISKAMSIHINTVTKTLNFFNSGGIEKLLEINYGTNKSELINHTSSIEDNFRKDPPNTIKEAAHRIEQLTGIKRSETQVRKFLVKIGMKLRKMGYVPAKANPEDQENHIKKNFSH